MAQGRVADSTVGLRVAPKRSTCGPLGPLRDQGAEHPPARPALRPGLWKKPIRDLHVVQCLRKGLGTLPRSKPEA